ERRCSCLGGGKGGISVLRQEPIIRHNALAGAPTDRRSLRPAGKQPNIELLRQADNAILAGAYPLAAVVDKRPIAEITGQRPAAAPALPPHPEATPPSGR